MNKHLKHLDLAELSTLYEAQLQVIGEMERKISKLQQIADGLFEIAPACPTRIALWKRYQGLVGTQESATQATRAARRH